jgi:exodeoxyribonuclease (lambda-induced)
MKVSDMIEGGMHVRQFTGENYRAVDLTIGQGDVERAAWLAERCGKLTASQMHRALDFRKDGKPGADRTKYQIELVAERLTQINVRHYVTPAMEWGIQTEPEAKAAYTAISGNQLHATGFFDHPTIDMCGATPDALVGKDGLLEVKCPTTHTFIDWKLGKEVPEERKPQLLVQLACTRRKWVDFFAFDPRIKNKDRNWFLKRFCPSAEEVHKIEIAAQQFLSEVDQLWEAFHS